MFDDVQVPIPQQGEEKRLRDVVDQIRQHNCTMHYVIYNNSAQHLLEQLKRET